MIETVADAEPATLAAYEAVIDVRSPAEFAEDHVPGAVNMPVLDNAERAEIGTIYVQRSKFLARRLGAAHVSRNIAGHLVGPLADKSGAYHPLVYCWRGGQRSNAMATVLSQVGWRTGLLQGGYRTYRRRVVAALYESALPLRMVSLCGGTGSGKTAVLRLLARRGVQVLDLEDLAVHRGSLFGGRGSQAQPSQKMFESRLLAVLDRLDASRPVVVEAESSRIGELFLPPAIWKAMSGAGAVELEAPLAARARHIVETCSDIAGDGEALIGALAKLPRHHGREQRQGWLAMAREGRLESLAADLIDAHYDPAYRRSTPPPTGGPLHRHRLADLSPQELERAADAVQATLSAS